MSREPSRVSETGAQAPVTGRLAVTHEQPDRIVLAIEHAGRQWEIDVTVDLDDDGGITVDIARDSVLFTSADFGWSDRHANE